MIRRHLPIPVLLLHTLLVACSSADPGPTQGENIDLLGGNPPILLGDDSGGPSSSSGATNCSPEPLNGCVGESFAGESLPLDIYIMFDQSGSMLTDVGGISRLQAVQRAIEQFLHDPASARIGVGIGYFGFLPRGEVSCDPQVYAKPEVSISLDHEAVLASLDARVPTGETPTSAALNAACGYASSYRQGHPDHKVVVLLVTDGKPEAPASCNAGGCCPTLPEAVKAAAACAAGGEGILTYVLGVGPLLDSINQLAQAGGTQSAYLVADQNTITDVLRALTAIRTAALIPCQLEIPSVESGARLDYGQVNVLYAAANECSFTPAYYVTSEATCDANGGWYYDNAEAPSSVKLCPTTCKTVSEPGAALRFSVGCQSVIR